MSFKSFNPPIQQCNKFIGDQSKTVVWEVFFFTHFKGASGSSIYLAHCIFNHRFLQKHSLEQQILLSVLPSENLYSLVFTYKQQTNYCLPINKLYPHLAVEGCIPGSLFQLCPSFHPFETNVLTYFTQKLLVTSTYFLVCSLS